MLISSFPRLLELEIKKGSNFFLFCGKAQYLGLWSHQPCEKTRKETGWEENPGTWQSLVRLTPDPLLASLWDSLISLQQIPLSAYICSSWFSLIWNFKNYKLGVGRRGGIFLEMQWPLWWRNKEEFRWSYYLAIRTWGEARLSSNHAKHVCNRVNKLQREKITKS